MRSEGYEYQFRLSGPRGLRKAIDALLVPKWYGEHTASEL
jgi:hypothetical protein